MILFKNGTFMTSSIYPNSDFSNGEALYVIPDDSVLANKVLELGIVDFITDKNNNLIDVKEKDICRIEKEKHSILNRLTELDNLALRPLRAILSGNGTDEDKSKLTELEEEAQQLRLELKELSDK
jgi:hypothetical protein